MGLAIIYYSTHLTRNVEDSLLNSVCYIQFHCSYKYRTNTQNNQFGKVVSISFRRHEWPLNAAEELDQQKISVIFYLLKSMDGSFEYFSLEKSINITSISATNLKIIIWFERYICWDICPNRPEAESTDTVIFRQKLVKFLPCPKLRFFHFIFKRT